MEGYYVGACADIDKRVEDHNKNRTRSTKNKGPYRLVHIEEFKTKNDALAREKLIKRYKGGRAFKKLINIRVPIV